VRRRAVRVLHSRHAGLCDGAPRGEAEPERGRGQDRPLGEPLPLHRVRRDREGRPGRGRAGRMTAVRADEIIRTTCPRDCYDACGIVVVKRAGVIAHVRGDRDHPVARGRLCRKCSIGYNGAWRDPEARLTQPLRRVGPKGEGRLEPVSWDEALTAIAERLRAVPPATVLNAHYTGTFALLGYSFPLRFFNRLGATEVDPD